MLSNIRKGMCVASQKEFTKGTSKVAALPKEILKKIAKFLTCAGYVSLSMTTTIKETIVQEMRYKKRRTLSIALPLPPPICLAIHIPSANAAEAEKSR